jgi:hypothetical protein
MTTKDKENLQMIMIIEKKSELCGGLYSVTLGLLRFQCERKSVKILQTEPPAAGQV